DEHAFADCKFTIDARYVKAYHEEQRVANLPTTHVVRTNKIRLKVPGWDENFPTLFTDLRIAAGGKKLYDALASKGRVSTQGILFDTGKDIIKPESTPTLKEV